jgi:hypothetical protein
MSKQIHKFSAGGQEGSQTEIHVDMDCIYPDHVCEHMVKNPNYGKHRFASEYIIPLVVVATNEGGYNCTTICIQCLMDALRENDLMEVACK